MNIYPEVTVGAVIINSEGKIFLMHSPKWKGKYVCPGGHIELGETAEEALIREIKEETNLNITDIQFLLYQQFIFDPSFWEKKHFIFLDFSCQTQDNAVILNDEGSDFIWINPTEIDKYDIEPYTRKSIEAYLELKKSHQDKINS